MEARGHDSICGIESLFDAISMMYVNIDVEHPSMNTMTRPFQLSSLQACSPKQFEDPKNAGRDIYWSFVAKLQNLPSHVVHIAETTRFCFLRMMQTARPIDRDICSTRIEPLGGSYTLLARAVGSRMIFSPRDPPAEIEQNSNSPSNAGQSSPMRPKTRQ